MGGEAMLLHSIDRFLLDKVFQKIADRFHEMTGKSCFWLAKVCTVPFVVLNAIQAWWYADSQYYILLVMSGISALSAIPIYEKLDKKDWARSGSMNPMAIHPIVIAARLFLLLPWTITAAMLIFNPFVLPRVFEVFIFWMWLVSYYFASCTPKPPSWLTARSRLLPLEV